VLELQPNHPLALNNLATLLAEKPNHLAEARKLVERAMSISGRSPPLLDTLGTILIRTGEKGIAVQALEEAVAGTANDPRFHFHLAVAYLHAGENDRALHAYNTALKHGLDRAILTGGDREFLATLERQLPSATN
jgi:Flp pilus assembly protein TadD